uniref:bifunctional diguanylate cyclase/phosphodiesterase n=1 Tax=Stutzerimonas azotifigens TaxID=291995 RepID=UPI000428E7FB|nr:EAL domain-containing protein [Stutzerimonas azotifigens]
MSDLPFSSLPKFQATFARRVLPGIVCLLLSALLGTAITLAHLARNLDREELERGRFLAEKALQVPHEWLARSVADNAFWGDAYARLNGVPDIEWAYRQGNLGPSLHRDFGTEGLFVVDAQGRTTYSVIDGKLVTVDAAAWFQSGLPRLLDQARGADEQGATAVLSSAGTPVIAAAAMFTPGHSDVPPMDGPASVLILADVLDPERLEQLGEAYAVEGLRVVPRDEEADDASIHLRYEDGTPLTFGWTPERPGRHMLFVTLPILALVSLGLGFLAWLLLRQALRATQLMDASYERLANSRQALAASEARFRDVAEAASDWIWETDEQLRLTYLSCRFEQITGHRPEVWLEQPLGALLTSDDEALQGWLLSPDEAPLRCRYRSADGHARHCRLAAKPILRDGRLIGYRGTATDTTEETEAQARIAHLSQHDALTGLPNRNQLREHLEQRLEPGGGQPAACTLLYIDLDRFKPINDTFGHAAGDEVLLQVAERLRLCTRDGDLIARLGGDEFVMVLDGTHAEADIEHLCARLMAALDEPFQHAGQRLYIGASIGIANAPQDAARAGELLRRADVALYQAKADGRGAWRFYSQEMDDRLHERQRLEDELRTAIDKGQFVLHFQPRYLSEGLRLRGAEALLRWQHPTQGLLLPDTFIPLAEETGLIVPLGAWVLREACVQARHWPQDTVVSVNLSAIQLRRGKLLDEVRAALFESDLPAGRLELEITESALLHDSQATLELLRSLKALGVRMAMDDFGTGYSSLSNLRNFPFDLIKIDRSFVAGMASSPDDQSIVHALIGLGRGLRLEVTAEGVETADQLQTLVAAGCTEVQGFHMSQPLPAQALYQLFGQAPG